MNTSAKDSNPCPHCGQPMPAGALAGLCPACLLAQGTKTEVAGTHGFTPPTLEEIARLFPNLEVLSQLGAGGMGAVYKARQPALDRYVALKILPPSGAAGAFADRFNREARALARLSHPNIVAVHEFGQAGDLSYFIMEFVDGANLRQLEQAARLSPREALQIIPQICDALQYAHDEGVVHRDIKPENVLVDRKGRVKIADFGLAKIVGVEAEALRLTAEGQVMGTPHYMAPEQLERPLSVDHRADIYSLGVVFYEMLTGDLPLGKFQPPSRKVEVDVRLDEVVLRALENDPGRRYQKASEVKTRVESIGQTPAPSSPAVSPEGNNRTFAAWVGFPLVLEQDGRRRVHWRGALRAPVILSAMSIAVLGLLLLVLNPGPRDKPNLPGDPATESASPLYFSPAREITFDELIDFDTGRTASYPPDNPGINPLVGAGDNAQWMVENGFDAEAGNGNLHPVGMSFLALDNADWESLSARETVDRLQAGPLTNPRTLEPPQGGTLPVTFAFRTREGALGLLQLVSFDSDAPGATVRAKLIAVPPNPDATQPSPLPQATPEKLAEKPSLRFLAWQDEWTEHGSEAACHPDGSPVTAAAGKQALHSAGPTRCEVDKATAEDSPIRFVHFWFTHPLFDLQSFVSLTLLDADGQPLRPGADGMMAQRVRMADPWSQGTGWMTTTLSPGRGAGQAALTVRLAYSVGPLERVRTVAPDFRGGLVLAGGSQLTGMGNDSDGKSFVALSIDTDGLGEWQFGVRAVTQDGRELAQSGGDRSSTSGSSLAVERFVFDLPLEQVRHFKIGLRPVRTAEWNDVILPPSQP